MNLKDEYLLKLIKENRVIQIKNEHIINSFETLYYIVSPYYDGLKKYDEIIKDPDSRVEFLISAVKIALSNKTMDNNIKSIVIQMYLTLINYVTKNSDLKEIIIPSAIKKQIFNKNFLPNSEQLIFLMTLIQENKKIFDEKFDGKDFSQIINDGLHKNIKEVLSIKKENLSHILGLTSQGNSLYYFYRKSVIDNKIRTIIKEVGYDSESIKDEKRKKEVIKKFLNKFKMVFGVDCTEDNYRKLINWVYKSDYESELTETEKALNKSFDYMPKKTTIDFYSEKINIDKLLKVNEEVNNFTYEYIRSELMLKELNNKGTRQKIIKNFSDDEINLIRNIEISSKEQSIRRILDKYIENQDLCENQNFQAEFKKKFTFSYPLIEFYKLLTKNINFYNFSLFENLNRIIVDYTSQEKINSDLFLVSYSNSLMNKQQDEMEQIISEDEAIYESYVKGENINLDYDLDEDYLALLKSLTAFSPEERYYFRTMDDIMEKKTNRLLSKMEYDETISLMGFATKKEEKERITNIKDEVFDGFSHFHYCETNQSTNYYEYITKWIKNGMEYPITTLVSESDGRILKFGNYIDNIKFNIKKFNEYKYNKSIDNSISIQYEKNLIKDIQNKMDNLLEIKKLYIEIYTLKENLDEKTIKWLEKQKEQLNKIYNYNVEIKKHFKDYIDYLDKNSEKINYNDNYKKIK